MPYENDKFSFTLLGCQNSPAKGARKCELHKEVARNFINDEEVNSVPTSPKDEDLLIVKVLNDRKTRQEHLFEVLSIFLHI